MKHNHNGETNSVRGFIFKGDPLHENVELKKELFRNQCLEQISHLANNKLKYVSRQWCCESMTKLLKGCIHGMARIRFNKVIVNYEKKNKTKDNNAIDYIMME